MPAVEGYHSLELIGRGGMGVVYRAVEAKLNRTVALKVLPSLRNTLAARTRFESEARLLAQVNHPGVARIFEIGNSAGTPYIAMEFIEGQSLDRIAAGKPLEFRMAAEFTRQLAEALHACHQLGIVHRDVKPSNALITPQRKLKLTDFGLAKLMGEDTQNLTRTGEVMGTPGYMAPEQASGFMREFGAETDVYGAGAVLYELLTGRPPFVAPEPLQALMMALTNPPAAPRTILPRIPADLETIVLKCLEKKKAHRYRTAKELAEDLERFLRGEPIRAKPVSALRKGISWIRRHPAWSSVIGLVVIGVLGSLLGVSAHNAALRQELDRTKRLVAEGRALSDWLLADFTKVLESDEGLTFVRSNLADRTQSFLDAMGREVVDDDGVKLTLAESLIRLASLQGSPGTGSLGMSTAAVKNLEAAQKILSTVRDVNLPEARLLKVAARLDLAAIYLDQREPAAAELLQVARAELVDLQTPLDPLARKRLDLQRLGLELTLAIQQADFAAAERSVDELNQLGAELLKQQTELAQYCQTSLGMIHARYFWLDRQGRAGETIQASRECLDNIQRMSQTQPLTLPIRLQVAGLRNLLAQAYLREGNTKLAETELLQVVDTYQALLSRDAKNFGAKFNLAQAWQSLGSVSLQLKDWEEAGERLNKAVQYYSEYAAQSGEDLKSRSDTLDVYQALANWHMNRGEVNDARREIQKAIEGYAKFAEHDWNCQVSWADALLQLGGIEMVAYADEQDDEGPELPPELTAAFERAVKSLQAAIGAYEKLGMDQALPESVAGQLARARKMLAFIQDDFKQLQADK